MIKSIIGQDHVVVTGGFPSVPYISPGAQSAGMMRWNTSSNTVEVYNGAAWIDVNYSNVKIELSSSASAAITWAISKMAEENYHKALAEKHPAIQNALNNLNQAKLQLDATIILSTEHDKTTS